MKCTPSQIVYGVKGCNTPIPQITHTTTTAVKPVVPQGPTLPFTGLDLGLIGGAGLVLTVLGLSLRRIGRSI